MVKTKICGITNKEDAFWASTLGADFIGLNFCKDSLRKISLKTAKEITDSVPKYTSVVGVFFDTIPTEIIKTMKKINIEYVQLHGEETKEICKELKTLFPQIKIIKVIKINPKDVSSDISAAQENLKNQEFIATTINQINDFLSYVDYFLFDTKVDTETGGTGKNFDWEIVLEIKKHFENLNTKLQFFVAGGLNPENVTSVVELLEPYGVDVASGVERLPRRKDFEKMKSFIRNAKRS